jgi:hypothetical protein
MYIVRNYSRKLLSCGRGRRNARGTYLGVSDSWIVTGDWGVAPISFDILGIDRSIYESFGATCIT